MNMSSGRSLRSIFLKKATWLMLLAYPKVKDLPELSNGTTFRGEQWGMVPGITAVPVHSLPKARLACSRGVNFRAGWVENELLYRNSK